jgi:predicted small secreted protein
MKIKKYIWTMCLSLLVAGGFTACSDDDSSGSQSTPMTISQVYLENVDDTVNKDRPVDFARLGQLIRIEGSGFNGLKKILINGYETYFNNALMTDNNVWVTLNTKTPIENAEDSVRNTITLVKDNTRLVYKFTVRASAPSISGCSNTMPKAGETVTVYGSNLQETTKITLPDGTEVTNGIISDEDGKYYTFVMPDGVDTSKSGSITSEGANGTAVTPTFFDDFNCYVTNFDDKGNLGSWSATYGTADLVDDPLNTGRGKVALIVPQSQLDNGGIDAGSNAKYWATAGNDNADDDWSRMYSYLPSTTLASNLAVQFDVYCPEPWDETGQIEISLQNNLSNYGWGSAGTKFSSEYKNTACVWIPWLDETTGKHTPFMTTGWQTVTIPLSKFGNYNPETATSDADKAIASASTLQNVVDDRNSGSYKNFLIFLSNQDIKTDEGVTPVLNYPAKKFNLKIYIDNIRIVSIAPIAVSDF